MTPAASPARAVRLRDVAARALVEVARRGGEVPAEVAALPVAELPAAVTPVPCDDDRPLGVLAARLELGVVERMAIALAVAVEDDPVVARAVAALQAHVGSPHPTVGLLAEALAGYAGSWSAAFDALVGGPARACGVYQLRGDDAPLADRRLALSLPIYAALRGADAPPAGATIGLGDAVPVPLPPSIQDAVARHARALGAGDRGLVVRTAAIVEGKSVCAAIAAALDGRAVFLEGEPAPGLGPWLVLRGLVPVFVCDLGPGELHRVPAIAGYAGPVLAIAGGDGTIELDGALVPGWRVPVPDAGERAALWADTIDDAALVGALGKDLRLGAGRIAHLARAADRVARLRGAAAITRRDLRDAAWLTGGPLGGLAEPVRDDVPDDAMVTTAPLRRDLELLEARCRAREGLGVGLGAAIGARLRPGVRALFVGPSGTGKTLAAGWLATRLGLPLYRVDLASTTSKYIGETEKNLAKLLAHAEHEGVVLLFDEADSMFGKRTEVKEANDRFANAQTNFLLQRIESFDGIVLLTSNSRSRLDAAFTRRLDAVLEFALPGPEERHALWCAHLGDGHALDATSINRLAVATDLVGGHVRNAVLTAAVLARGRGEPIRYDDILVGLAAEYRKLGRTMPDELRDRP